MGRARVGVVGALLVLVLSACVVDVVGAEGPGSAGYGINDSGQIVGAFRDTDGFDSAFVTDRETGAFTPIGRLPGARWASAQAINDAGVVVGSADIQGSTVAFRWDPDTAEMEAISVFGWMVEQPGDINEQGQIVGTARPGGPRVGQAFVWDEEHGGRTLPGIGPAPCTACESGAGSINEAGVVVGAATTWSADGFRRISHAMLWDTATGETVDLGALTAPDQWTSAEDINDRGVVVGSLEVGTGVYHAVQWTEVEGEWTMLDLTELSGGKVDHVTGINDAGQLAATDHGDPENPAAPTAYRYTPATNRLEPLGDLGFGWAWTSDINRSGDLSGTAARPPSTGHAVRFDL